MPGRARYFSQFGEVTRFRLSRSKKTGGSKAAFVDQTPWYVLNMQWPCLLHGTCGGRATASLSSGRKAWQRLLPKL